MKKIQRDFNKYLAVLDVRYVFSGLLRWTLDQRRIIAHLRQVSYLQVAVCVMPAPLLSHYQIFWAISRAATNIFLEIKQYENLNDTTENIWSTLCVGLPNQVFQQPHCHPGLCSCFKTQASIVTNSEWVSDHNGDHLAKGADLWPRCSLSLALQCSAVLSSAPLCCTCLSQNLKLGYACGVSCWLGSYRIL